MCRNIKVLYNFEPPTTEDEVHAAALQFVRKVSGFTKPSKVNEAVFERAVREVAKVTQKLLDGLETSAPPRDRDVIAQRARERAAKRYGLAGTGNTRRLSGKPATTPAFRCRLKCLRHWAQASGQPSR